MKKKINLIPAPFDTPQWNELRESAERQMEIMKELQEKNPSLPIVTTFVMAQDIDSCKRGDRAIAEGASVAQASVHVGSYARLGWLVEKFEQGLLPQDWLLTHFPHEWVAADPDDTDPKFLKLWERAFVMNGSQYIHDEEPLTVPEDGILEIHRGQLRFDDPLGIAWTTDREIAIGFARGKGLRVQVKNPIAPLSAHVRIEHVLGYMTARGESEIVVNPKNLINAGFMKVKK